MAPPRAASKPGQTHHSDTSPGRLQLPVSYHPCSRRSSPCRRVHCHSNPPPLRSHHSTLIPQTAIRQEGQPPHSMEQPKSKRKHTERTEAASGNRRNKIRTYKGSQRSTLHRHDITTNYRPSDEIPPGTCHTNCSRSAVQHCAGQRSNSTTCSEWEKRPTALHVTNDPRGVLRLRGRSRSI